MRSISIGFIYRKGNPYLNGMRAQINMRKLFFDALPQVENVSVEFHGAADILDLAPHADRHDAWIFFDAVRWGIPLLKNADKIKGLKVCYIGDCHGAQNICPVYHATKLQMCEHFGFDAYFFQHHPEYFRRFFPADWKYWWVPMGVDLGLYSRNPGPYWETRRADKVLLTGVDGPEFYPLRTRLRHDPRCHYNQPGGYQGDSYSPGQYDGDRYAELLGRWRASVASGYSVLNKCFEIPAAGCVSLLEVTQDNGCGIMGYANCVHAVHVTPENVDEKIDEFLATPRDPVWQQIAERGRLFTLAHYTHGECAKRLVRHIRESL